MTLSFLDPNSHQIRAVDGSPAPSCHLTQTWDGTEWSARLRNTGDEAVRLKEVVLFCGEWPYTPETPLYGEGFQMLAQYDGTLENVRCFGGYSDADHYRIPQAEGAQTVYNLLLLSPPDQPRLLLAFSSCHRFSGEFRLYPGGRFEIVLDTEGRELAPGDGWELETLYCALGDDRETLLCGLADRIAEHHPPLFFPEIPTGWCSWYHYYTEVTEEDILQNLSAIVGQDLPLRYVQIDDGYQAAQGDWLLSSPRFPAGSETLLKKIKAMGLEPAIWVGPFIAEADSQVFKEHPDWFVRDERGEPLQSDTVTFGGWRAGPWYCLDGTHPEAQAHLERVFGHMREAWGCSYFKLDANFWGAIHGGRFYDPQATRVEAYRRGMEAVLRGAGDAFVLGCNAPMWASLGLVHGMRVTNDISRSWESFRGVAQELFHRNWQNGRLWINDPDCIVLEDISTETHQQQASLKDYFFHASALLASGGMVLSGDALCGISAERLSMLMRMLPPIPTAARFKGDGYWIGRTPIPGGELVFCFNWDDVPQTFEIALGEQSDVSDFWTDESLGDRLERITLSDLPPRSARVLRCLTIEA